MAEIPQQIGFAEIDIHPEAFGFMPETTGIILSGGFSSRAIRVGEVAIKVSKASGSEEEMGDLAAIMQLEEIMIAEFVGDHIPSTSYTVTPSREQPKKSRVVTVQEFIDGMTLAEYRAQPHSSPTLVDFLLSSLDMHRETRRIPDLANVQTGFNIFGSKNVVMSKDTDGEIRPFLVDTNFGRIQGSRTLGPLWTRAIASGVRRGLQELN